MLASFKLIITKILSQKAIRKQQLDANHEEQSITTFELTTKKYT